MKSKAVALFALVALLAFAQTLLAQEEQKKGAKKRPGGTIGKVKSIEPLITGFLENNSYIGRPVDVLQLKDGSMLVSDDWNGAVYRVTYGKQKVATQ